MNGSDVIRDGWMDGILLNEAEVFLFFNYLKAKAVGRWFSGMICFKMHFKALSA